jgi:hypothetical protein
VHESEVVYQIQHNHYFNFFFLNGLEFDSKVINSSQYLRAELTRMTASTFPAVRGTRREAGITFAADLFLAVVFRC